jgi:fluoroquinolone transport system ATP-binding protein
MTVAEQLCDRVAFVVDGEIVVVASPKELMLEHGTRSIKVEYVNNGKLLEQNFDINALSENKEFMNILKTREIKTMHSFEASLEDIFIKLTGRNLL